MEMLSQVSRALEEVFGSCAEEADERVRVIQRLRKFTPALLAKSFILALLRNPQAGSADIAAMAAVCGVRVSPQAVDQRISGRLAEFFEEMFMRMTRIVVASQAALAPILEQFTEVILLDSSTIALPDSQAERFRGCGGSHGGGKSALKLQTELDLRSGALRCVQIEEGRATDGASSRQQAKPAPGSLRIADLGYFNLSVFRAIAAVAYYLSRVQHHTALYVDGRKVAGLVAWLNGEQLPVVDRWVELGCERLPCRLIAWRLPTEVANRRRQKLRDKHRKKWGTQPRSESLAACDWMFLVTNLSGDQLSIEQAIVLYRSRWQIELLFKRWKSLGNINRLDGRNDRFTMVRLWARLCAAVIQHWLTTAVAWSPHKKLSLSRVAKLTREFAKDLALALSTAGNLTAILHCLARMADVSCQRNKRKNPGTFELLQDPTKLTYSLT